MKIVYCLSNVVFGGKEVATCTKANALSSINDNDVWLAITEGTETLPTNLSHFVHIYDLGVRYNENPKRFPWNIFIILQKKNKHRKALKTFLRHLQPDIVVSTSNEILFLASIKGPWKTVREQHSLIKWDTIPTPSRGISRFLYNLVNRYENACIRRADWIIVLTEKEKNSNWKNCHNVSVIPNPLSFYSEMPSSLENKRAIAVGRMTYAKNHASLVRAWSLVSTRHPEWRLDIYGAGGESLATQAEIEKRGLTNSVTIKGHSSNIEKELLSSSIFVMSSRFESFGNVIIEAMAAGLPVVSFSSPYGPESIISEGKNGFLVPVGDEDSLADRIIRLIENQDLRKTMGAFARQTSEQYRIEFISVRWMALFEALLKEN